MVLLGTLKDAPIKNGTRVVVRADFDVSLNGGEIEDDLRIQRVVPTLKFILSKGGFVRIISHVGRPGGRRVKKLEMRIVANRLEKLLKKKIVFVSDPLSSKNLVKYNRRREIIFFENIRFWKGEENNDIIFAKKLSRWGNLFVNEAFAASHRNHATVALLPKLLPSFAGLNLEKEVYYLSTLMKKPLRPFVAILGGAKLETKMPLVERFLKNADRVVMGGALANQAFYLKGLPIGKSPVGVVFEKSRILRALKSRKLYLPADLVVSGSRDKASRITIRLPDRVRGNEYIVDVGPVTVKSFIALCHDAKTIVWNGPLGLTELKRFARGTVDFARGLAGIRALKIVGGGDTLTALRKYKLLSGFTFVSTGGGAMLDFLAGKKLPGIEILKRQATSDKRHG